MFCAVKNKGILLLSTWASPVVQMVKNLLAMQETCVWSLGWENPPEKEMVTRSNILAWEIPWTEEPGGLQSMGSQSQTRQSTHACTVIHKYTVMRLYISVTCKYDDLCLIWTSNNRKH